MVAREDSRVSWLSLVALHLTLTVLFIFFLDDSNCLKVIRTIMERSLAPVIIFSFSRKECEAYALQISKLEFNSGNLSE